MATILIVDDHRGTRLGLAEMLGDAGYAVVTTGTFQEARDLLRDEPPDLLIADVRLGSFNGLQLVISGQHRIPAIVITGYADPVLEAEARRGGAEYLVKPFDPERLLTMIREKLGASPPAFAVPRRWRRKTVAGLTAHVDDYPARIVDVSYGGVKFEIRPPDQTVPAVVPAPPLQPGAAGRPGLEEHVERRRLGVRCGGVARGVERPPVVRPRRHRLLKSSSQSPAKRSSRLRRIG